jgi:signal transduction histidine kinase/CheY-like chemotaxis protein
MREIVSYPPNYSNLSSNRKEKLLEIAILRFGVPVGQLQVRYARALSKKTLLSLELLAGWAGIAFERHRSGVQLQALLDRLKILNELNLLVASKIPIRRLASSLAGQAAYHFAADMAITILMLNESLDSASITGAYGCQLQDLPRHISLKEGYLSQLVSFGGQATLPDITSNQSEPLAFLDQFGVKCIHGGILDIHGKPNGAILLGYHTDRVFTIFEEEQFDDFCRASAVGILNSLSREQLLTYSEHLHELVESQTADLVVQTARAEEASSSKSRFLANMSHELRTPLTSIIGYTSILTDGVYGPMNEKQTDAIVAISRSSEHLKNLINDILDLARIESGKEAPDPRSVSTKSLLSHSFKLMQQTAAEKPVEFEFDTDFTDFSLFVDPKHVQQILINLVSNAIKYTPPKGTVSVTAHSLGSMGVIRIRDTGVGFSPELLQTMYDRFSRGTDEYSRSQEGTGIGLYIVQQLTELNNGSIEVDSEVGRGTQFSVFFPLAQEATSAGEEEGKSSSKKISLTGSKILILEDDQQARKILRALLEARGAEVVLSDSIASAIPHVDGATIDLIITDIGLYKESGIGFIEQVRQKTENVPIIVLSGSAFEVDKQSALKAGANDFIAKPFDTTRLLTTTKRLLSPFKKEGP